MTKTAAFTDFDLGFKLDKHPRPCFEHLDRYAVSAHNLHGLTLNTSISVGNYYLLHVYKYDPTQQMKRDIK